MTSTEARVIEMLIRVRQFGLTHASSFPANSAGAELLTNVAGAIENMEGHSANQSQHARAARQQTRQKTLARRALHEAMEAIARTARAMTRGTPGLQERFRLPDDAREQSLLATARAFTIDVEPLKDDFIKRGMPNTFLDDLKAQIHAIEQSLDGRAQKSAARISATAAVSEAADRGRQAVRELDAVVRNVFADDNSVLAEWESASRIERAPQRSKQNAPAPDTAPTQA